MQPSPNTLTDVQLPNQGTFTIDPAAIGRRAERDERNPRLFLPPTFSGSDIQIYGVVRPFRHQLQYMTGPITQKFFNIHTISYSSFRIKKPVRSLGTVSPKGYTRGTRTVAGSIVFVVEDQHPLIEMMMSQEGDYDGNRNHYRNDLRYTMSDQIPPFDVHIFFTSEMGFTAKIVIFGVDINSEGQTMSIQDMYTENVMQYTALDMQIMHAKTSQSLLDIPPDDLLNQQFNPKRFEDILRNSPEAVRTLRKTRNPFK